MFTIFLFGKIIFDILVFLFLGKWFKKSLDTAVLSLGLADESAYFAHIFRLFVLGYLGINLLINCIIFYSLSF